MGDRRQARVDAEIDEPRAEGLDDRFGIRVGARRSRGRESGGMSREAHPARK